MSEKEELLARLRSKTDWEEDPDPLAEARAEAEAEEILAREAQEDES